MTNQTRRRGRPRPQDVIARDEHVYQLIRQRPRSRVELVALTHLKGDHVYLVLRRLNLAGRIERVPGGPGHVVNVWQAT